MVVDTAVTMSSLGEADLLELVARYPDNQKLPLAALRVVHALEESRIPEPRPAVLKALAAKLAVGKEVPT